MQITKSFYTKSIYSKLVIGVSLVAGVAYLFFQNDSFSKDVESPKIVTNSPALENEVSMNTQALNHSLNKVEEPVEHEKDDPFEGKEVKYRFQQIAAQYADEIQYPSFSRPIPNETKLLEFKPNRSYASSRPINLDDVDGDLQEAGPRISLKTSKLKYYPGEEVLATANVSGLPDSASVRVAATVRVGKRDVASAIEIVDVGEGEQTSQRHYEIRFADLSSLSEGSSQSSSQANKGEMDVVVDFNINGQSYWITSLIRYPDTVARLDAVGDAEVQNEYLSIPMHISTNSPGIHAVKANLYDAASGKALIHLNHVERLTSETGVLTLKAHIAALKKMGHEGPYELRDISLTRGASAPKYMVEQGFVEEETYPVSGFSFSDYEDVAYVDEAAQRRLAFLTQLSQ